MVCYYHNERDVVGQCPCCGKGLCPDCFNLIDNHMCYHCAQANNAAYKKNVVTTMIWTIITLVAAIVAMVLLKIDSTTDPSDKTLMLIGFGIWIVVCVVPAWRLITIKNDGTRITWMTSEIMILNCIFWVLKFAVALCISIFVPIIYVAKLIYSIVKYKQAKKTMAIIDQNQALFVNVK